MSPCKHEISMFVKCPLCDLDKITQELKACPTCKEPYRRIEIEKLKAEKTALARSHAAMLEAAKKLEYYLRKGIIDFDGADEYHSKLKKNIEQADSEVRS